MNMHRIRDRVADTKAAAELLCDTTTVLELAVDALAAACPHGSALAFTRRPDGSSGPAALRADGTALPVQAMRKGAPARWIVDLNHVPAWQQQTWVEPMRAGVHGPDYFSSAHPVRNLIGPKAQPDYGRMMVCHGGRMIAWAGLYVVTRNGFRESEQIALAQIASQLALPLRIAAALDCDIPRVELAPRQQEIITRVALGWTNKRIARDLDISPATVKTVLERLFRYSRAGNRAALVDWWRRGG
jgi:DNA-binding CsgD family transcriptional regulator